MELKICSKCKEEKPLSCFTKDKYKKCGLTPQCTACRYAKKIENQDAVRLSNLKQRTKNKDKIKAYNNSEEAKEKRRIGRLKNRESKIANYDPEKRREYYLADKQNQIAKSVAYKKTRLKKDPAFKLAARLRSRLYRNIRYKKKIGSAIKDLGCSIIELKQYLESKFKPGMTWDNYCYRGWHVDHIIPLSSFDLTNREQLLTACHYTNLQPLWASENLRKSNKLGV